jgi:hypothetical protein
VNCCVVPFGIDAVAGVIEIEVSVGAVMVSAAVPLIVPKVAVMVALPCATPVARPAPLIVAAEIFEDVHVTVRGCVVLLLYIPVAVNCWASPAASEADVGATDIVTSTGAVTDRLVEPVIAPETALMLVVPIAIPVANPPAPMDATAGEEDNHVADAVRFCVLPSL